jgi:hypothetical protein
VRVTQHLRCLRHEQRAVMIEHRVDLGLGSGAQHDRGIVAAALLQRRLEAGGHRQQRHQHAHYTCDADYHHRCGAQALR